ncbi:MAG TPA: TonB family protein, partial [Thermoanaerobaculia bacterium]|nr:TonB family protein [Thermoanaerobaculia bacterium]
GEVDRSLAGLPLYHQGPHPPKLERRVPVELQADASASSQGVAIAEVVISPQGRIARARILRAPKVAGMTEAVVASLREWRFQPARLEGEPVAVYYAVTLPLADPNTPGS